MHDADHNDQYGDNNAGGDRNDDYHDDDDDDDGVEVDDGGCDYDDDEDCDGDDDDDDDDDDDEDLLMVVAFLSHRNKAYDCLVYIPWKSQMSNGSHTRVGASSFFRGVFQCFRRSFLGGGAPAFEQA